MNVVSVKDSLPTNYVLSQGLRLLRLRDALPISVRSMTQLVWRSFFPGDMNTGHVYATTIGLRFWGDGSWFFGGRLSDTSVVSGDNFAIGFLCEDGGCSGIATGELGSSATRRSQHQTFSIHGRDERLQRNFWQVVSGKIEFRLHVSDDVAGVFADIKTDFKNVGWKLEVLFNSGGGSADIPRYPNDGGPPGPGPMPGDS